MKTLEILELTAENFAGFGTFANMLQPEGFHLGSFYRDMLTMPLTINNVAGFSNSVAVKGDLTVKSIECHDGAAEAFMPMDGDIIVALGEATVRFMPPVDKMKVFRIPAGTMVIMNPGTWHGPEIPVGKDKVNVLTVLPERCYALDCFFYDIPEDKQFMMAQPEM